MTSVTYSELIDRVVEALRTERSIENITYLLHAAGPLLGKGIVYTGNQAGEPSFDVLDYAAEAHTPGVPRLANPEGFEIHAYGGAAGSYDLFGGILAAALIAHIPEICKLAKPLIPDQSLDRIEFRIDYRTCRSEEACAIHYWEVELTSNAAVDQGAFLTIEEDDQTPLASFLSELFQPLFDAVGCSAMEPAMGQDLWDRGQLPIAILRRPDEPEKIAF